MNIIDKINKYLGEEVNKTIKLLLTKSEKQMIGDLGIYKEKYKLDRTQTNYRYNKHNASPPFVGKEDLKKLSKLIDKVKK